jgi:UDP-N-acetyl-D-galactosamine dehydrogenase
MKKYKICIFGLGYVGLPLAVLLSKKYEVSGFDINFKRILDLKKGIDKNLEFKKKDLINKNLVFYNQIKKIAESNIYIITVPTPVNKINKPDLSFLKKAFHQIKKIIKNNDTIIVESTVAPGTVEEMSKFYFYDKYSKINICFCPERINPGDKKHKLSKITKVISSNTKEGIQICKKIYSSVIKKVFISQNIKTAEMAKIIENTQRDVNIALMNEFGLICNRLDIDINEVIRTCKTKWNALNFYPGLVGGHCVPVDPYYLIHKVRNLGLKASIMIEARKTNEQYINFIEEKIKNKINNLNKKILYCGLSFKNNVVDVRNSKHLDLALRLKKKYKKFYIFDPYFKNNNNNNYKFNFSNSINNFNKFNIIIIATTFEFYKIEPLTLKNFLKVDKENLIIDLSRTYNLKKNNNFFSF